MSHTATMVFSCLFHAYIQFPVHVLSSYILIIICCQFYKIIIEGNVYVMYINVFNSINISSHDLMTLV